jgi:heat shock protein HslJ
LVQVIDNIKVMPDSRVTIVIRGGGISGAAPCNTYRGSVTVTDREVRVGQILRTMMACDPARMSEEADFFALLNAVTSYEVRSSDTLILSTRAGKSITARRSPGTLQHD